MFKYKIIYLQEIPIPFNKVYDMKTEKNPKELKCFILPHHYRPSAIQQIGLSPIKYIF